MSIVVEDFHKTYGDTVAVAGITFTAEPGEILGLVGPNGAGKTTTMRALAGILAPTRGSSALQSIVTPADGLTPFWLAMSTWPVAGT